jgi:hypothetical protein
MILSFVQGTGWKKSLAVGFVALIVVLPVLAYSAFGLGPTSQEAWDRAQEIIVHFRIPHHSIPALWFDNTVLAKLGLVLLALAVVRKTSLFWIMAMALTVSMGLTLLQVRTELDTLAFIAPWRISVFLVPLATAMLLAYGVSKLSPLLGRNRLLVRVPVLLFSALVLLALVSRGAGAIQDSVQARQSDARYVLYRFVKEVARPGETYLVPPYMAGFRLATGVPVVVTHKSHPYEDVEVIEWFERLNAANAFYTDVSCQAIADMAEIYGISHVVLESGQFVDGCEEIRALYVDEQYGVFQVLAPE